jgi:hypothetical protein
VSCLASQAATTGRNAHRRVVSRLHHENDPGDKHHQRDPAENDAEQVAVFHTTWLGGDNKTTSVGRNG